MGMVRRRATGEIEFQTTGKKKGRPLKFLDKRQFEYLARLHPPKKEIADFFNIDVQTLDRWVRDTYNDEYNAVSEHLRAEGKTAIRKTQWDLMQHSDDDRVKAQMSKFLGKQYLGQSENPEADKQKEQEQQVINELIEALKSVQD